jgi:hypothetical protein
MTGTTHVDTYLDAVRLELADLPAEERTELLEDVEAHLAEVAAEQPGPLDERLGTPAAYAAELRAAAGLPPRTAARQLAARFGHLRTAAERVAATRAYREVRAFAPELRPAWWVARGYLVVLGLALLTNDRIRAVVPVPHLWNSALAGFVAAVAAVVGSVAVGRRGSYQGWQHVALAAVNVVAVLAALNLFTTIDDHGGRAYYYTSEVQEPPVLRGPQGPIGNVFAFDADGRPLDAVRLFDDRGRSLADMICGAPCGQDVARSATFPLPVLVDDQVNGGVVEVHPTPPVHFAEPTPTPTPSPSPTPKPTHKPSPTPSAR